MESTQYIEEGFIPSTSMLMLMLYIDGRICLMSKLSEASHLRHPNLASMLGYCCSDGQMIVGYNDEGLGILLSHLSYNSYYNLPWNRLNILVGAADALRCLHTAKIIHGGVSPTTILVDSSSRAKLVTVGYFVGHMSAHNAHQTRTLSTRN